MSITQLYTMNEDYDLSISKTVLITTARTGPTKCQVLLRVGDGTKDCTAVAGEWQVALAVGNWPGVAYRLEPTPQKIWAGVESVKAFLTREFVVQDGMQVACALQSPNAADSDVDVTAYLYDTSAGKAVEVVASDVLQVYSDTTIIVPKTSDTHSLLTLVEVIVSDTESNVVVVASNVLIVKSDTSDIISEQVVHSDKLDQIYSDTSIIYSDTKVIEADVTADEGHSTKVDYHSTKLG